MLPRLSLVWLVLGAVQSLAAGSAPRFHAVALYENGGHHVAFTQVARPWLDRLAAEQNFSVDYVTSPAAFTDASLAKYQLVIQLDYAPYGWPAPAAAALLRYLHSPHGGWVGFHHASLVGAFDGFPRWDAYGDFIGGITFKDYIPGFADGTVHVEDPSHPLLRGLPATFRIQKEEWYTYDRSPRAHVHVLASVDERSYSPDSKVKMGDHPVIWTNPSYEARNAYIFMGHSPALFSDPNYRRLVRNALFWAAQSEELPTFAVNQAESASFGSAYAVLRSPNPLPAGTRVRLNYEQLDEVWDTQGIGQPESVPEWSAGDVYYRIPLRLTDGDFTLRLTVHGTDVESPGMTHHPRSDPGSTVKEIVQYFHRQRATAPAELAADRHLVLYGSARTVDLHGGWCDASGDVSKYFSHLAYTNVMAPQQTPLVVWSLAQAREAMPEQLAHFDVAVPLEDEALYGADYLLRSLSDEGYFYMIVFSYFNQDPAARRVVGLHADSVTTDEYACSFRQGGGLAIAALARVSRWKRHGEYSSKQYLAGAKRAFAHLQANNLKYDNDHQENLIDEYCALLAATELWNATDDPAYHAEARRRALQVVGRLGPEGYFRTNDAGRPFWHASDAGLPIVALARYLRSERDSAVRKPAIDAIGRALDYELRITAAVPNPFGYARQTFWLQGEPHTGFFIPHDNESGWWWQGENARLASWATAAIEGGRLARPGNSEFQTTRALADFAAQQMAWIGGCNPYGVCFVYGSGDVNVPHMRSHFGHGSEPGGISNGITGREGNADGSGIDYQPVKPDNNEWRWTEQWLPHAAWYLQAVAAANAE